MPSHTTARIPSMPRCTCQSRTTAAWGQWITHGLWHWPDCLVVWALWSLAPRLCVTLDTWASPGVPNGPVSVRGPTSVAAMSLHAPRPPQSRHSPGKYHDRWLVIGSSNWLSSALWVCIENEITEKPQGSFRELAAFVFPSAPSFGEHFSPHCALRGRLVIKKT